MVLNNLHWEFPKNSQWSGLEMFLAIPPSKVLDVGKQTSGEKKLGKVITPDPWKTGARNTTEGGGRKVGENKALTAKKNRFAPYEGFEKCKICKSVVHQKGSHYCQGCAYKKGICAMCGKKIIETKNYRQTSV